MKHGNAEPYRRHDYEQRGTAFRQLAHRYRTEGNHGIAEAHERTADYHFTVAAKLPDAMAG